MKKNAIIFILTFLFLHCGGVAEDPTTSKGFNSTWTPQYDDLVEYWNMSGSAFTDGSIFYATYGDNGTIYNSSGGGLSSVNGMVSTATHFSGNNAWISVPYRNLANPLNFSISLWARVTGGADQRVLVASQNAPTAKGYALAINSSGQPEARVGQGTTNNWGIATGQIVLNNVWNHLVFTYDGTWIRLYQNGTLTASTLSAMSTNISQPLYIGAGGTEGSPSANEFFNGDIDELAIWGGVLSASEVETIYQRQKL